jgi:hypothetical protein
MTQPFEWQFGGWLRGFPPATAWSIVAVAAVTGLVLVVWLYRRTLRQLPPTVRNALTVFRAAIVLLLLLCLANPSRVEREKPTAASKKTLAVIVDRSASMSIPDYRRVTRLAGALRVWKLHEGEAASAFSEIKYYRFATELAPAASLDEAVESAKSGPETHLYSALRQALDAGPDAVVCLTDGLDTTGAARDELAGEALHRNVPLYFVAGINRLLPSRSGDALNIREIKVPGTVLRQAQFSASAVFEVASPRDSQLPVELWSGNTKLASTNLSVRAGENILPWSVLVTAPEPGTMPLEFRAGKNPPQSAACTVEITDHKTLDVLYYQGTLQWGYRFLRSALASELGFRLTSILNPALNVKISVETPDQPTLPDLPEDVSGLKPFQIIVLAHVFANQLTARQQAALVDYVQGGGAVLFISPDTQASASFAGSALEQMLPVVFGPSSPAVNEEDNPNGFRLQITVPSQPGLAGGARSQALPGLKPFALPAGATRSAVSALFEKSGESLPHYVNNARVRAVKPGAEVLAVSAPAGGGEPQVLLARQQFGNGFAVAMMTDLLWRWKMSLPSSSHALEKFWQQLLLSLAPSSGEGFRLVKLTESPSMNQPLVLQITGNTAGAKPDVEAVSPLRAERSLTLQPATNGESAWTATFTPDATGDWEVRATGSGKKFARLVFPVPVKWQTAEMMNVPPDVDGMSQLTEATGGAMIEDAPVFQPREDSVAAPGLQHVRPLWNSSWLLGGLLGLYATELIVRRRFKLL